MAASGRAAQVVDAGVDEPLDVLEPEEPPEPEELADEPPVLDELPLSELVVDDESLVLEVDELVSLLEEPERLSVR